ncbi:A/G-specific adenine glycosylase [Elsinoe australis]|uniref:Adenine DNA glycosylase n=1 Tax=Elsinoe australis TaxID=40998 RepID=A0A2P8AIX2_9PEZI|nr:A/G-specific adenine glycosylase [Elsinoe australis]
MAKRSGASIAEPAKRQKTTTAPSPNLKPSNHPPSSDEQPIPPALPPLRPHPKSYHRPLLTTHPSASHSLLQWYDATSTTRNMPWRKPFPASSSLPTPPSEVHALLSRRAYEVWVSEIMLQQTRVSTVIPYFNSWIAKWPDIHALAEAEHDEVLAAWKGLGYYSRATRLWKGAKMVVGELGGNIPGTVEGLLKVAGIGPYTAGAVASIAFGKAVPLVDGNVARVLSRQVGVFGDMKRREVDGLVWEVAREAVEGVTRVEMRDRGEEGDMSDVPGRWNQALMELGSTVCMPRPKCGECPIRETCRVYAEGELLVKSSRAHDGQGSALTDIEDACSLCESLDSEVVEDACKGQAAADAQAEAEGENGSRTGKSSQKNSRTAKAKVEKGPKQRSLQDFAFKGPAAAKKAQTVSESKEETSNKVPLDEITAYCSLFPKRAVKRQVPEEDCAVCVFEFKSKLGSYFLIEQRPETGLLASMWQFPNFTVAKEVGEEEVVERAATLAVNYLAERELAHVGEIGCITHVFSHLKLNMHLHSLKIDGMGVSKPQQPDGASRQKWVDEKSVDDATMGTGMKRCWELFKSKQKRK